MSAKGKVKCCQIRDPINTEGLFDEVYNSDPSQKCMNCYEYKQSDKMLGATVSKTINPKLTNHACRVRFQTQQNGPYDFQDITGGNMVHARTAIEADRRPMSLGNREDVEVLNARECFNNPGSKSPDFTTMPVSIQGGMSSGLSPSYPLLRDEVGTDMICESIGKIRKDITEPLQSFKDGVLYSITFGKNKGKEKFGPFDNYGRHGHKKHRACNIMGKVVGAVVLALLIWLAISMFLGICLNCARSCGSDDIIVIEATSGGFARSMFESIPNLAKGIAKKVKGGNKKVKFNIPSKPFASNVNLIGSSQNELSSDKCVL